ncbi:MAG: phosphatidylglycerophosphatase A [Rhodobacteraceae bacterium]|nr:phosphatidylglycerophosphatase A [Paracoccaceae bacterium]
MSRIIATVFGLGHLPFVPGTMGSASAVAAALAVSAMGIGLGQVALLTLLICGVAWWAVYSALPHFSGNDPSVIVVDEFTGQWVALIPLFYYATQRSDDRTLLWLPGVLAAFALFRLLDIAKPLAIGSAESLPGATGVMLDDILAGMATAIILIALAVLSTRFEALS